MARGGAYNEFRYVLFSLKLIAFKYGVRLHISMQRSAFCARRTTHDHALNFPNGYQSAGTCFCGEYLTVCGVCSGKLYGQYRVNILFVFSHFIWCVLVIVILRFVVKKGTHIRQFDVIYSQVDWLHGWTVFICICHIGI